MKELWCCVGICSPVNITPQTLHPLLFTPLHTSKCCVSNMDGGTNRILNDFSNSLVNNVILINNRYICIAFDCQHSFKYGIFHI